MSTLKYVSLALLVINFIIAIVNAIRNEKDWSAVFGWACASIAQLQIVLAG